MTPTGRRSRTGLIELSGLSGLSGLVIVVLALAVALSGCTGLPRSSGIQSGLRIDTKVDQRARVIVGAPIPGAPQDVIARDFIRSGADFQETDASQQVVGRAYLAPSSVERWKPTTSVTVYDAPTGMSIEPLPADQLRLTVNAVATIDTAGHYVELPPGSTRSIVLSMVRVDGEWRIDLPDQGFGLWLNTDDFDRVFSPYDIHYVAGVRHLISDVRWFPSGASVATALARAQLGAVPDYLVGVAENEIPTTTQLAVDAVAVDSAGTATVTLTNTVQTVDPDRRRAMWAQFVATLLQVPTITAVSLQVDGIGPIPVPNLPKAVESISTLGYSEDGGPTFTLAAVRRGVTVEGVDPEGLNSAPVLPATTPLPGTQAAVPVSDDYTGLALSPDGGDLAAVARSRQELVRWYAGVPTVVPTGGVDLTDPSYDSLGRLWVAGLVGGSASLMTFGTAATAGKPAVVRADWLTGRRVVALRVSSDGTRVAVVSRQPDGSDSRLDISGVLRDADGVPTSLASPYRQGQPLVDLSAVIWLGPSDLAVLARERAGAPVRPFAVSLGGGVGLRRVGRLTADQLLLAPVPGAVRLSARGGGIGGLIVMTETSAQLRLGSVWQPIVGVRDLVVAGG